MINYRNIIATIVLLSSFLLASSQVGKKLGAKEYISSGYYKKAIEVNEDEKDSLFMYANKGLSYLKLHAYKKAYQNFNNVSSRINQLPNEYKIAYFETLRVLEENQKAENLIDQLGEEYNNNYEGFIKYPQEKHKNAQFSELEKVNVDFGAYFMGLSANNDELIITKAEDNVYDIYKWSRKDNSSKRIFNKISNVKYRANPSFLDDNKFFYVKSTQPKNKIFQGKKSNKSNPLKLYFFDGSKEESIEEINNGFYNVVTPFYWKDRDILFFSANQENEDFDIYYVTRKNQSWSKPIKIDQVNSPFDEVYPFLHENKLYFSSKGHNNLGGLDVFSIAFEETGGGITFESSVVNLGEPLNSSYDDFSLVWLDENQGFVASNRSSNGKDELFEFSYTKTLKLKGLVVNTSNKPVEANIEIASPEDKAEEILKTGKLGSFEYPFDLNKKIALIVRSSGYQDQNISFDSLLNLIKDQDTLVKIKVTLNKLFSGKIIDFITGNVIPNVTILITENQSGKKDTITTNDEGEWSYPFDESNSYEIELISKNHDKKTFKVSSSSDNTDLFSLLEDLEEVKLLSRTNKGDVITINNIYFDFSSASIRKDSYQILDNLSEFLKTKKDVKILIGAHTDCEGSDESNLYLSKERARNCQYYLVRKGISKRRLQRKGYGEKYILNGCTKPGQCTEKENEINRRIELKII